MWQAYMPTDILRQVWHAQVRFGWDDQIEFIPYWRSDTVLELKPRDPEVAASVFKRLGRIMIVAMNNMRVGPTRSCVILGNLIAGCTFRNLGDAAIR